MKGNPDVIACLKELLRGELAARDQYFIHSRRYEDQGLFALYERLNHEMEEEPSTPMRCCAGSCSSAVTRTCARMPPSRARPWRRCCRRISILNTRFGTISPPA